MNETRLGELQAYCYLVDRGKPAACMAVKDEEADKALEEIWRQGLRGYIEELGYGWKTIWIFKKPFVVDLIKEAPAGNDVVSHWYWGKLFGYSDEEIERFLFNKVLYPDEIGAITLGAGGQGVGAVVEPDKLAALGALVRTDTRLLSGCGHIITTLRLAFTTIATSILQFSNDRKVVRT